MRLLLAAAIALTGAAPPPQAAQPDQAVEADCAFLPGSDLSRYSEPTGVMARAEREGLARARAMGVRLKPPAGYLAGRVLVSGTQHVKGGPDVVVAFKREDGRWFLRARAPAIDLRQGRSLTDLEARTLDSALTDACLAKEPAHAPRVRPGREKGELIVCADGQDSFFDIDVSGVLRRKFFHECSPDGAATRVKAVLHASAFGVDP